MNRNQESRFALNPGIRIQRSRFDRSHSLKTSFNFGDVVPVFVEEVLPGDTFSVRSSKVIRMPSMLVPVMDNMYLDIYYHFVPYRLVWEHWKEFNGENTQSAWIPAASYTIPQITAPSGGWNNGTIADYLGVPTGVSDISVSALPFRAYALIMNEWFRDENLQQPLNIPVNDSTVVGSNGSTFVSDVAKGGAPFIASKFHDYFTSALPSPQKGPDVPIPLTSQGNYLPVVTRSDTVDSSLFPLSGNTIVPMYLYNQVGTAGTSSVSLGLSPGSGLSGSTDSLTLNSDRLHPTNLWTDAGSLGVGVGTINQLRLAFQIQKLLEKDARGGTRYTEILRTHFNTISPDYRLQRPEYLGGNRIPINVNQVVQTSGSASGTTPQANVAAYSLTHDTHSDFTKSFTEHGIIIGVAVARYDHTYQQGIERFWSRKTRYDFYWPVLANIGEQAILNKEIFAQGSSVVDSDGNIIDDQVFGYQEAWADYRYKPNRVTGQMRSNYATSLDIWHLGDDYASLPALSDSWIVEDKNTIDRTLAVTSAVSNQIFADFYFRNKATRPMPVFSVPGLIDHH